MVQPILRGIEEGRDNRVKADYCEPWHAADARFRRAKRT